jgi:hypothetical protein
MIYNGFDEERFDIIETLPGWAFAPEVQSDYDEEQWEEHAAVMKALDYAKIPYAVNVFDEGGGGFETYFFTPKEYSKKAKKIFAAAMKDYEKRHEND